jgi:hypothetical protein
MAGLQGANVPGADTRCVSKGTSSLSSFLRVAKRDDDPGSLSLDIIIPEVKAGKEPIDSLQHRYDEWKRANASVQQNVGSTAINIVEESTTTLLLQGLSANEVAFFELYAIDGAPIVRTVVADGVNRIDLNYPLRSGIYMYRARTSAGRLATGKLLIVQ